MHEMGIVFHIAKKVEQVAEENKVSHVNRVVLRIGEVSTVVGSYLTDCWNWVAAKTPVLNGAKLEIEGVSAITYCENCRQTYPTVQYGKICPYCKSENTYLLQGNETEIKEIEVC